MLFTVGGVPLRASLGISHLPGSPGSEGELNRASATGSICAEVMVVPKELLVRVARPPASRLVSLRPTGTSSKRVADFLVGHVDVLIGEEAEELVLDDGAADTAAENIAVQLRHLVGLREYQRPD